MRADLRNYTVSALLALAGIALALWMVWRFGAEMSEPAVRFLAPGAASVEIAKPGGQVIWHEHRTLFDGRTYDAPQELPKGMQFRVVGPDGAAIPVRAVGKASFRNGGAARVVAAGFDAPRPGAYTVAVEGRFEPRVFSVGPEPFWPLLRTIGGAFALALLGIGAGGALALYTFLSRLPPEAEPAARAIGARAALAPQPTSPAASKESPDKPLRDLTAVVYGLHAAALLVGITAIAAVIVNYVKRGEVAGTWLESHFTWQIRTFWFMLLWSVVGLATLIVLVGIVVLVAATVWYVYRIVRGWTRLNDGLPMYAGETGRGA